MRWRIALSGMLKRLRSKRDLLSLQKADNIRQLPNPVGKPSGHCWRNAQALVNASKVVMDEMNRAGEPVTHNAFRKGVREPGESAHLHPDLLC
jgi:hypothetical protein